MTPAEFIQSYIRQTVDTLNKFPVEDFARAMELIFEAGESERRIYIFGNGGSGSTASHFQNDINKSAPLPDGKRFQVQCLNDNIPIMLAYGNDLSYADIFVEQLMNFVKPGDVVIGISGSGNSENVLRAVAFAQKAGAKTIGFTGFSGGKLSKMADVAVVVPIHDMQTVEDLHLMMTHMTMQFACRRQAQEKSRPLSGALTV